MQFMFSVWCLAASAPPLLPLQVDPFFVPTTEEEREEHGEDGSGLTNLARKLVDAVRRRKVGGAVGRGLCDVLHSSWGLGREDGSLTIMACTLVDAMRRRKVGGAVWDGGSAVCCNPGGGQGRAQRTNQPGA